MTTRATTRATHTVSGPGVDRGVGSHDLGISFAITCANEATRARLPGSFYVRNGDGEATGRVDSDGAGGVQVYGSKSALDRAPDGPPEASEPSGGRSKPTRASGGATLEGERARRPSEVPASTAADEPHGRSRVASEAPPARPSKKEEKVATAEQKRPAKSADASKDGGGADLVAALMKAVGEKVEGVESVPNKSGTYHRLLIGKKAFAYIFPPRPSGVALKIPKPLLAVEKELPSGHGFKRTNWGLTRTITKASEAPKVAQALAVAAAAVQKGGESAE